MDRKHRDELEYEDTDKQLWKQKLQKIINFKMNHSNIVISNSQVN